MTIPDDHRRAWLALIAAGLVTPAEAAREIGVQWIVVKRWLNAANIDAPAARTDRVHRMGAAIQYQLGTVAPKTSRVTLIARIHRLIEQGLPVQHLPPKLRTDDPPETVPIRFAKRATNPHKTRVLAAIQAGDMTIEQAAKFAGVSIRAIQGWIKLHKI